MTIVEWVDKSGGPWLHSMNKDDWSEPIKIPDDVPIGTMLYVTVVDGDVVLASKHPMQLGPQRLVYSWNGNVYSL